MAEKNLVWSDDLKSRLLQRVAAQQLGLGDEEVDARLQRMLTLLPALRPRLASMRPATLAALARDADALAGRLVQVRGATRVDRCVARTCTCGAAWASVGRDVTLEGALTLSRTLCA